MRSMSVGVALLLFAATPAVAERPTLPALFGDHMVLQRDCRVPVWGTAAPGTPVTVSVAGRTARARAGADGRWSARLAPLAAGGPHTLRVIAGDTLTFHDVMVGEVWLASGQSNMEMPVSGWGRVLDDSAEVANAVHPDLRFLQVAHRIAFTPESEVPSAGWKRCSPETVRDFSAVAYFVGRALARELEVPVGLIQATWGGTEVEAWTRTGALRALPGTAGALERVAARAAAGSLAEQRAAYRRAFDAWLASIPAADRGSLADPPWSARDVDDHDWPLMTLPTGWENAGLPDLDGVVWFRREFEIPAAWAGRAVTVHLGRIDDVDTTYVDGVAIGHDTVYDRPREYPLPVALATPGRHTLAVRVYDWIGGGGLWGEAAWMKLVCDTGEALPLAGPWRYHVALDLKELGPRPRDPEDPNQPGVLANGMIAPLVPYAIRGVLWYQGEQNADRAEEYRALFPGMIDDWRRWWGRGDFPFLFVQLAGFTDPPLQPGESAWAELREAQALALARPRTGMAVAADVGDARDIHPRNKQEVARRLALAALDVAYGRPVVSAGPRLADWRVEGGSVRLRFTGTAGGLRTPDGVAPRGFAVAGADRVFHWADARVAGDEVTLTCAAVAAPVAVRYAWASNPACELRGGTGLPVAPFRTDRWPGIARGPTP